MHHATNITNDISNSPCYYVYPVMFHEKLQVLPVPCRRSLADARTPMFRAPVGRPNVARLFARHNSAYVRLGWLMIIEMTLYVIMCWATEETKGTLSVSRRHSMGPMVRLFGLTYRRLFGRADPVAVSAPAWQYLHGLSAQLDEALAKSLAVNNIRESQS